MDGQSEPRQHRRPFVWPAVVAEAGDHPNVGELVYIAAFAPDKDESVETLIVIRRPRHRCRRSAAEDGFLALDRRSSLIHPRPTLPTEQAKFMADSQVPWGVEALGGKISEPAWHNKPSWYLVATEDRMIPSPAQQQMSERAGSTIVETPASHSVYVSQPDAVADLIEEAAKSG